MLADEPRPSRSTVRWSRDSAPPSPASASTRLASRPSTARAWAMERLARPSCWTSETLTLAPLAAAISSRGTTSASTASLDLMRTTTDATAASSARTTTRGKETAPAVAATTSTTTGEEALPRPTWITAPSTPKAPWAAANRSVSSGTARSAAASSAASTAEGAERIDPIHTPGGKAPSTFVVRPSTMPTRPSPGTTMSTSGAGAPGVSTSP